MTHSAMLLARKRGREQNRVKQSFKHLITTYRYSYHYTLLYFTFLYSTLLYSTSLFFYHCGLIHIVTSSFLIHILWFIFYYFLYFDSLKTCYCPFSSPLSHCPSLPSSLPLPFHSFHPLSPSPPFSSILSLPLHTSSSSSSTGLMHAPYRATSVGGSIFNGLTLIKYVIIIIVIVIIIIIIIINTIIIIIVYDTLHSIQSCVALQLAFLILFPPSFAPSKRSFLPYFHHP